MEPLKRGVLLMAAAVTGLLMALSPLYGFHRDELYFLDCARHLSASYVDQPVFVALQARITLAIAGPSLVVLRLWPALAAGATVVVAGMIARELRGNQLYTALATATMPVLLAVGHLFGPTVFDVLAWAALAWIVLRIDRTGNNRWWVLAGLVLGVGLTNKHSIGFLAVAVTLGALFGGGRPYILNRWFLAGGLIAALFLVPEIWWQSTHGWATIAMTQELNRENGGLGKIPDWVVGQVLMVAFALIWVWMRGLRELWRSGRALRRALVWAYALLFVFFAVTSGAKIYYLAGLYVPLLAAGTVGRRLRPRVIAAVLVSIAAALPLVLPVLPASDIGWTYAVNQENAETVGWPQLAAAVKNVWESLPPDQRAHTVIFTDNYGEAGAIDSLDRGSGMPAAVSGHNTLWWWGPGDPAATTVIAVTPGPVSGTGFDVRLGRYFGSVTTAATLGNPAGLHNQEDGGHVYLCTDPVRPWGSIWPELRHYG